MNSDQELRSLKRGLRVLALLNTNENLSISELARDLELPRTTTERILLTLVAEGYVHRVPDAARYRLSSRVCTLSGGFSDDCRVVQAATPLLRGLTERIGWPLAIATPRADRMVLRSTSDAATSLWLQRRRVGGETPMLCSSSGLVAYAFASLAEQHNLRNLLLNSSCPGNLQRASDPGRLDLLIQPVLRDGFALQPPPSNNPESSIAVPVLSDGRYVASLLLIYMVQALSDEDAVKTYAGSLRKLADRIGIAVASNEPIGNDSETDFVPFGRETSLRGPSHHP
jgi:IclR family transcriptional regulator, mhp operon transcriptional activator